MQPSQALQTVLGAARKHALDADATLEDKDAFFSALELCEQILSVAVPIARFRCFVTVEKIGSKSKLGLGDFAVSGIDISAIKNGLVGLSMEPLTVYIQLWEHRSEGKFDMLSGYQGPTKNLGFRNWLKDIDRHNEFKPTNVVEALPSVPSQS